MPGSCARCNTVVYFNEEKIAIGKSWHKSCFSCGKFDFEGFINQILCLFVHGRNI